METLETAVKKYKATVETDMETLKSYSVSRESPHKIRLSKLLETVETEILLT